jgi:hypothetical protein
LQSQAHRWKRNRMQDQNPLFPGLPAVMMASHLV